MKITYNISLSTNMGIKKGTMSIEVQNEKIEGILEIMQNENYFFGTFTDRRTFTFEGMLKTFSSFVEYVAQGYISDDELKADIITEKGRYRLHGSKQEEKAK